MGTVRDRSELMWLLALLESLALTRDGNVERSGVSELTHCLQTADRARRAGADDELVLVALLHDAAKSLSLTSHGEVIAEILAPRISRRAIQLLRVHGELQGGVYGLISGSPSSWSDDEQRLAVWDAASFDPAYPTPSLDEFRPLLGRLYDNQFAPIPQEDA